MFDCYVFINCEKYGLQITDKLCKFHDSRFMRIDLRGQAPNRNSIKQTIVCANYCQILLIVRNRQGVLVFARNQGPGASAAPAIERECCEKYHLFSRRRHGTFDRDRGADSRGTEAWIAR